MTQPGYDALAQVYSEMFPTAYQTPVEQHAVAAFADLVLQGPRDGIVVDVGCGVGHVAADLTRRGLDVIGVDPSQQMLQFARRDHPELRFVHDDARLRSAELADEHVIAILARFSLIHVPPSEIPAVFAGWAAKMDPGSLVAVACQSTDQKDAVVEFDHAVASAWRWHPDRLSRALSEAGFEELWRTVNRPDANYRFPMVHVVARLGE